MKILYLSSPSFFDSDLCYVKELRNFVDLTYLIDLPSYNLNYSALEVDFQPSEAGIIPLSFVKGLEKFSDYLGQNCYVINRPFSKRFSYETLKINRELKKFILQINPDILHFNNPISVIGRSILKLPILKVMTIHDPIPHIGESKKNIRILKSNMKFVNSFILLNEFQKVDFIHLYNLKKENVHTTFLGSYNSYSALKQEVDLGNKKNLLFFGRITPYKGLNILIEVFNRLKKTFPDLTLTIAGKGQLPLNIINNGSVKIINRYVSVDELSILINSSTLVVCPYIEGTQSGVIMTSFAFSKPVLASNVGGFGEMIEDEITGFLVQPENINQLEEKLISILNNPDKLKLISDNISSVYHNNGKRSWYKSAEKTFGIYKTLLIK